MDNEPTITLHYVHQKDGRRGEPSSTTIQWPKREGSQGDVARRTLYTEVQICAEDGTIETIQYPFVPSL